MKSMHGTVDAAVRYIGTLNRLAKMSEKGFFPFSRCSMANENEWSGAIVYLDGTTDGSAPEYDLVAEALVDPIHHEPLSRWGDLLSQMCQGSITARARIVGDGAHPYVSIEDRAAGTEVIIENGRWYLAG